MADRKITELLEAGTLTGAELIALVQSGVTRQTTINALKELVLAVAPQGFEIGDWYVTRGNALAVVTISALPGDGGAQITDVAYRVDGGSWISSGGDRQLQHHRSHERRRVQHSASRDQRRRGGGRERYQGRDPSDCP